MNIAPEIIRRAEKLHKDCGISLQAAFGQVIGQVIFEVDAELWATKDGYSIDDSPYGSFLKELNDTIRHFLR